MQSKAKSNTVITHALTAAGIVFTVGDAGTVAFDYRKAGASNREQAEVHGWVQRISDAAAMSRTDEDGKIVPEKERNTLKLARMRALAAFYEEGGDEWSRVGVGGPKGGLLLRALVRLYPQKTFDQVVAFLDKLTAKEQARLRGTQKVRDMIETIRAEGADSSAVDTEELLAQLDE
jgi:hypothetical protein